MQTRDEVEGLHNCLEFSQPLSCLYQAMQTRKTFSIALLINTTLLKTLSNKRLQYRVFSHDFTAAILVSHNNETAAMLVSQTSPLGVELFSYAT